MKDTGDKRSKWDIQTDGHNYEGHIQEHCVKQLSLYSPPGKIFSVRKEHFKKHQSVPFNARE